MSSVPIYRRQFLTLLGAGPLAAVLLRVGGVSSQTHLAKTTYSADVSILWGAITLRLQGTIEETVDRAAGRYQVRAVGEGDGIANRIESAGRLRDGRWTPERATSWFNIRGRESRGELSYDWNARKIDYRFRGETFFLRRLRVVEDTLGIPTGQQVDDVISALLNYMDDYWKPQADGAHRTQVVRRRKREGEGPDDVDAQQRAELVPFEMRVGRDAETGKPGASFDMTRFSSWARTGNPARIVFAPNRRPELIASSLILGTTVTIRLRDE
jgi:hypothetical protein